MISPAQGTLLIANPFLKDPNFMRTVIFLCEHQEEGSFGFVINKNFSKTLEYAYDDWCIARFAKMIGKNDDYNAYIQRAQAYKNVLDMQTGFMRPKKNGNWISPFDPREVNNNFTEANSWQYSFLCAAGYKWFYFDVRRKAAA